MVLQNIEVSKIVSKTIKVLNMVLQTKEVSNMIFKRIEISNMVLQTMEVLKQNRYHFSF